MVRRRQVGAEAEADITEEAGTHPTEATGQTAAATAEAPVAQAQAEEGRRPYNPVRSWTERHTGPLRYQKLTDDRIKKIIFRFKLPDGQKTPPEEVLEVMRSHKQTPEGQQTGLKFEDTRTHGKVWTIPNDAEGRDLADRIDFKLNALAHKMEAAQPTPA